MHRGTPLEDEDFRSGKGVRAVVRCVLSGRQ